MLRSRTKGSVPDSWPSRPYYPSIRTIGRTEISIPWSRRPHGLSGDCSELRVLSASVLSNIGYSMLDGWTDRVPPLHGDLTTLREVAASDVHALFTLFSDPAVTA